MTRSIDLNENRVYRAVITSTDMNTNKPDVHVFGPYGMAGSAKGKVTAAVKHNERMREMYPLTWTRHVQGEVQVIEGEWKPL